MDIAMPGWMTLVAFFVIGVLAFRIGLWVVTRLFMAVMGWLFLMVALVVVGVAAIAVCSCSDPAAIIAPAEDVGGGDR